MKWQTGSWTHSEILEYISNLKAAILEEAYGLSIEQLSKVRTLYNAKLDEKLLISLKEKYPALFERPNYKE